MILLGKRQIHLPPSNKVKEVIIIEKYAIDINIKREFKDSKSRFISIIALIFLGVFVFMGLKVSGSNIRNTAMNYFKKYNLADSIVISNVGLENRDIKIVENYKNIKEVEPVHSEDLMLKNSEESIRVFSVPNKISKYELVAGREIKNNNEILLDLRLCNKYNIGDNIILVDNSGKEPEDKLKKGKYILVGFVNSTEYIDKENLGQSLSSDGKLDAIAYIKKEQFLSKNYSMVRIKYKLRDKNIDKNYSQNVKKYNEELLEELKSIEEDRYIEFKNGTISKIENERKKVQNKKNNLDKTEKELENLNREKISAELSFGNSNFIDQAQVDNEQNDIDYIKEKIETKRRYINKNKKNIDLEYKYINKILDKETLKFEKIKEVNYQIFDREEYITNYFSYIDGSYRLDTLSNIFPVFFFSVALLVTLSTMMRMVDEQRNYLGLLKALGYSKISIMKKFIIYGFISGFIGCILGVVLGQELLSRIVFGAYSNNYIFDNVDTKIYPVYIFISFAVSLSCTVVSSIYVANKELKSKPIQLMMKKSPKKGSRLLIEKIPFIWNKMSFNNKVTARNIFRYKIRMMMTILGVAGCTALLVMGIGIRDSISGILNRQFGNISKYDLLMVYDTNSRNFELESLNKVLKKEKNIKSVEKIKYDRVKIILKNKLKQKASIMVINNPKSFNNYIRISTRDKKAITLNDNSVIINEKLEYLLDNNDSINFFSRYKNYIKEKFNHYSNGDYINSKNSIIVENDKSQRFDVKYQHSSEWYLGHNMYMTPYMYKKIFKQDYIANAYIIKLKDNSDYKISSLSKKVLNESATKFVVSSDENKGMIKSTLDGLNYAVLIMIVCSLVLAYVVLYNLTNINISERKSELSTIKVLGFYPKEVTMYIFKETIVLTVFGILLGFILGTVMHKYIIYVLPPDDTMFIPEIRAINYIVSALLTFLFSTIVMFTMHKKINKVNMVDAMKE